MTPQQLAALVATHPEFDPAAQTVQCSMCHHRFDIWFNHDRLAYVVSRPVGRIVESAACADCGPRLRAWYAKQQPRGRPGRDDRPDDVDFPASAFIG